MLFDELAMYHVNLLLYSDDGDDHPANGLPEMSADSKLIRYSLDSALIYNLINLIINCYRDGGSTHLTHI